MVKIPENANKHAYKHLHIGLCKPNHGKLGKLGMHLLNRITRKLGSTFWAQGCSPSAFAPVKKVRQIQI